MTGRFHAAIFLAAATLCVAMRPACARADEIDKKNVQDGKTVRWVTDWKVGDKYAYMMEMRVEKTVNLSGGGKKRPQTVKVRMETPVAVEILKKQENSYTISWTSGKVRYLDGLEMRPDLDDWMNYLTDVPIIIEFDSDLQMEKLGNFEELKTIIHETAEKMVDSKPVFTKSQKQRLQDVFSQEKIVFSLCTRDPSYFFGFCAQEFEAEVGETVEYESEVPTPFSELPIPTVGQVTIKSIDETNNTTVLEFRQEADLEGVITVFREILERNEEKIDEAELEEIRRQLKIAHFGCCTMDLHTGWPLRVEYTVAAENGNMKNIHTFLFTLRKKPKPASIGGVP